MAEKAEEVVVQTSDIEFIRDTLANLYYLSISLDLQDQYRRLDDRGATSALTVQAEEAHRKASAVAALAEPTVEVVEEEPEQEEKPAHPVRQTGTR